MTGIGPMGSPLGFVDQDGNEIDVQTWGRLFSDTTSRTIAMDIWMGGDGQPRTLATMWLGHLHEPEFGNYTFGTALLIGPLDRRKDTIELEGYPTKQLAVEGHARHLAEQRGDIPGGHAVTLKL